MMYMAKELLEFGWEKLSGKRHERTNLNSKMSLIRRLRRGREARAQFVSSHLDKTIAFQLRAIRDEQNLSQEKLAEMVGMNQNAISRLESEWYGKPTIRTLKRLAAALDVALVVRFVPFGQLVDWVSGTPFVDEGLSTDSLAVPNFEEEEKRSERAAVQVNIPIYDRATKVNWPNFPDFTTNYDALLTGYGRVNFPTNADESNLVTFEQTIGPLERSGSVEEAVGAAYFTAVVAASNNDQVATFHLIGEINGSRAREEIR
ncbi:MAG: helix-turn-helix domain-containing protein [Candidatus Acidiferrales bacterium]